MNGDLLLSDEKFKNYCEYILANVCFDDEDDECSVCEEIILHKKHLDIELNRDVGIEVALIDYLKNFDNLVHIPDLLDSTDIRKITHQGSPTNHPKAYDASVLSRDIQIEIERTHRYGSPFSVLLMDILIPESPENDNITEILSKSFSSHIRKTDSVYTYDRAKYIFLLGETNVNDALQAVFNIIHMILIPRQKAFPGMDYRVGAATFGQFHIDSDHKLLTAADKALNEALNAEEATVCLYHGKDSLVVFEKGSKVKPVRIRTERLKLSGSPVHGGLALGSAFVYNDLLSHKLECYDISPDALDQEFERIKRAIHEVEKDLKEMEESVNQQLSKEHSVIFQAHRLILNDSAVLDDIKTRLFDRKVNAEEVIRDVFKRWEKRFLAFDDEIFRNKSQDISDISRRILSELQGIERHILEDVPADSIIFSTRLLPSDTVHLNKKNVKAIITREGSRFSHAAVIAKAMNIPTIVIEDLDLTKVQIGAPVFLDGDSGTVILNPEESEYISLKEQVNMRAANQLDLLKSDQPSGELLYNKQKVQLLTVAANRQDAENGRSLGADGIGLFRMEMLYLIRDSMPDETWLIEQLLYILEPVKNEHITIRLLDIGGDKTLSYMEVSERYNSFMGVRGIRFLIRAPELLETQIRVCLRLAQEFKIRMLIPMVTLVEDVRHVKILCREIRKIMNITNEMPIGAMIETPAAVIDAENIIKESDFVSIGTNDLIQYTMAADREKLNVSQYYEKGNIIIQDYIRKICSLAQAADKPCCICGDLAQNPDYTEDLLRTGCRSLSVSPAMLPLVRSKILSIRG